MKHLLTAALIAIALASPVRGDDLDDVLGFTIECGRDRQFHLDRSDMEVSGSGYSRGAPLYFSGHPILIWNDDYITWTSTSPRSLGSYVTMYSLQRSSLRLLIKTVDLAYQHLNYDDNPVVPKGHFYRCERAPRS